MKFEKTPLKIKASAVLTAPVIIAVYSVGRVVNDGNPLIMIYIKTKIDSILNANIILFLLPNGILARRLNKTERNLLTIYNKNAINITIIRA